MKAWTPIARVALGLLPLGVSASAMLYYARHEAAPLPTLDPPRTEFVHAPGVLVPSREIKILATGESRVVRIEAWPGRYVSKGQPLAVIESDTQREAVPAPANQIEREVADARAALQAKASRLRTEEAALAIARSEYAMSEERWRKARELNESGLIARLEFESEQRDFEKAQAALREMIGIVEASKIARDLAAGMLAGVEERLAPQKREEDPGASAKTRTLRSPVEGIVGEVLARAGEVFPAPANGIPPPVVMTVLDPSRLHVRVLAPGSQMAEIFPDADVSVEISHEPLKSARGRVISTNEETAGVRELLIEIDGGQSGWRAGQICTVIFPTSAILGTNGEFETVAGAAAE